ncbi:MAG: putative methyl-accepting chemotaxis protein [Rhizobium sp.]|nr:putative methyl-accepting chemotaxis protein [Rhizobium sp.]
MRFRRSAPVTIVVAIFIVIAATTFLSSRLFSDMTDAVEADQFKMMQAIAESAIRDAENRALGRAELIADMPEVRRLFAVGDRDGLLAELSAAFANQKARHGVDQAQFHTAAAISFLRLHDPKTFGDDLTTTRPMVVAANRERQPLKGIAIARNGPGIFGIALMNDPSGKHVGSFEIGMNLAPILSSIKTTYGVDLAFFAVEQTLRQFAPGADPERLGEQNRVGRYIRFETTNSQLMAALAGPDDIAVVDEPINYVREVNGFAHGVVVIPINNSAGTTLGLMAISSDFSGSRAAVGITLIWQAVLGLVAILLLSGLVIIVLRGFLLRPLDVLSDHFKAVHTGAPMDEIPGVEHFPEELHPFVGLYDRIRARRRDAAK